MYGIEYQEYDSDEADSYSGGLLRGDRLFYEYEREEHGEDRAERSDDGRVYGRGHRDAFEERVLGDEQTEYGCQRNLYQIFDRDFLFRREQ